MKIHKAGHILLFKAFVLIAFINVLVYAFIPSIIVFRAVLIVSGICYLLMVNFFRFPNRQITVKNNTILAPADGKIVVVEETFEPEYLKKECIQVSIFMNIFNVHINWFPINGIIKFFKYHQGRYMAAYLPKSSTENERTTIAIEATNGQEIVMRQIAGAMAKRIVSYAPVGGKASQDEHAGFIKFGSRVDLYLPLGTKIDVKLGQKVTGSQTLIGTFQEPESK
ncbi:MULTISPECIES: phosphatidylserine decarboxylase family protein [Odoribacteraceae]|uniref:phosphatidylserine decarboxylase family protein n=1 Tax=Odoribacteraceae TaxID=1853231 RepID=UPI000E485917|nr:MULTISPECIES: phosphatidylserine decarboxylase family protein [Odoribacteraceae]MCQ4874175.1 phosphatidylserine decarboxylase family protein [Butyricimonas paravirosa]RHR82762.1 phosphatidylserine decarboxylase family protein [Odoribacter sp. AF15-53]